jgi:predicted DNA-binding protein YlxM (UPF0122 family)
MALTEKRTEAERFYVQKGLSCTRIASELAVHEATVYKWKAEAADKGEAFNWDTHRQVYNISPRTIVAMHMESIKQWVLKMQEDPSKLGDPKMADALSKHVSAMKKLDSRSQYLGAVTDLIKIADTWLANHNPKLKKDMEQCWEGIYQELSQIYAQERLF